MPTNRSICCLALALLGTIGASRQELPASEARAMWERMIAAKGGHERLQNVKSFVIATSDSGSRTRPDVAAKYTAERVVLLPDGLWLWADSRPGSFGVSVQVINFARQVGWMKWLRGDGRERDEDIGQPGVLSSMSHNLEEWQLVYFLETSALRPEPIAVLRTSSSRKQLQVRTAKFASALYTIDSKTSLPVSVTLVPFVGDSEGRGPYRAVPEIAERYDFAGTVTIDGIQMPERVKQNAWIRPTYVINPQLDPKMFDSPPVSVEAGAWRKYLR